MWKRLKWPLIAAFVVITGFAFRKPGEKYFDIAKSLDIFATLFKEVNAYYVDEVEPGKLVSKGIDGMLESLDPYTDYIPEEELESFKIVTTGQYGGIGALIGVINKKTVITEPYVGYPAYRAGLKVGDEIIAVDGTNVQGGSSTDVSAKLKGQPRTEVEVKVKRYGQRDPLTFTIKREKINLTNLAYFGMISTDIGYVKLDDFTPGAAREVGNAVEALKKRGAKSMIIDLRDNPGGLLHEAVNIVNLFIPKGLEVVSTRGKSEEWNKKYTTLNNPLDTQIPLVILTNGGSASASEIVAGSLQDYDRAVLIGENTFGKGLVQTTRPLAYGAQLKVTTAKYYIPSGRCIQALDYTHRKEDGTVVKVADSLKNEFKTKQGRKVFDGGGLDPDVHVGEEEPATVTVSLINAGLIFEYASKYCAENPAPVDYNNFVVTNEMYERFVRWVREQNFSYTTALEANTKTLLETARREKYYPEMENLLTGLKNKVESNKATDLERFKGEISRVLAQQIAFHYGLNEGQAKVSLKDDKVISKARLVLNDQRQYTALLSKP